MRLMRPVRIHKSIYGTDQPVFVSPPGANLSVGRGGALVLTLAPRGQASPDLVLGLTIRYGCHHLLAMYSTGFFYSYLTFLSTFCTLVLQFTDAM